MVYLEIERGGEDYITLDLGSSLFELLLEFLIGHALGCSHQLAQHLF